LGLSSLTAEPKFFSMSARSTGLLVRARSGSRCCKHAGHPQSERLLDDWTGKVSHGVLYQVRGMRLFKHFDRILNVTFLTQSRDRSNEPSACRGSQAMPSRGGWLGVVERWAHWELRPSPLGGCVATGAAAPRLGRFSHFTRRLRAGPKPKWPLRGCFAGLSTTCATQDGCDTDSCALS